jgi:hypothetical protein
MATTNLIEKSLGNVLIQSGNGTPDHTADKGTTYTNIDTGTLSINTDGTSGWSTLNMTSFGEIYIVGNTSTTTIGTQNQWYTESGTTWTTGTMNGFSRSVGNLFIDTGRSGKYEVILNSTIEYVGQASYEVGICHNNITPSSGAYGGATVTSVIDTSCINVNTYIDLDDGDSVALCIRNTTGTSNVIVRHGSIIATRVGDI